MDYHSAPRQGVLYSTAYTNSLYVLIVHGFFLMSTLKRRRGIFFPYDDPNWGIFNAHDNRWTTNEQAM